MNTLPAFNVADRVVTTGKVKLQLPQGVKEYDAGLLFGTIIDMMLDKDTGTLYAEVKVYTAGKKPHYTTISVNLLKRAEFALL